MPKFVAFLRGINVGKAKRVAMADLRGLLAELGYTDIATLLNSGNVIFRSTGRSPTRHAENIAAAILERLKIEVPVIVKSANELLAVIRENDLAERAINHSQLLVIFAQSNAALSRLGTVESLVVPPEQFLAGKQAAYLHCATGILESKAAEALLGKLGKLVTTRNWATVLKLQALLAKPDS